MDRSNTQDFAVEIFRPVSSEYMEEVLTAFDYLGKKQEFYGSWP